jgi:iron(III) transport system permease protein
VPSARPLLVGLALLLAGLALLPVIALGGEGFGGLRRGTASLGPDGLRQLQGTVQLLLGTGGLGACLGTANGWLLACCRFPGRRWLRIAQLLPLASPSYLLAATLVDLASRDGWRVQGMGWGILVLALSTYPYVFLLSTESFSVVSRRQLEACRSLGVGPWGAFRRVALPMALPAIGAGVALMGMEVVNELGAVQLLSIPSVSAGILQRWQAAGDPAGATLLAMLTLLLVAALVMAERGLRRRSRRWSTGGGSGQAPGWPLRGVRALLAQSLALLPPLLSLGIPVLWLLRNLGHLAQTDLPDLLAMAGRTLGLALAVATLVLLGSLLLSVAHRWIRGSAFRGLTVVAGLGYAMPGAVLGLGLLLVGGPLGLPPLLLLLWGCTDRFLAVAKGGLDAALERLPPSLDEAATVLGCSWGGVLGRVHLPLLRGPMLVGCLLVFVDTVKELPLTFALRPFGFDTLAVRVFQYASDERLAGALLPAMVILLLGLLAALALVPSLEGGRAVTETPPGGERMGGSRGPDGGPGAPASSAGRG